MDFETFVLKGPLTGDDTSGNPYNGICGEKLEITGGVSIPTICGTNTGQHCKSQIVCLIFMYLKLKKKSHFSQICIIFLVYFEFDDPDDKSVKLEFKDMDKDFDSKWDILASQIQCSSTYK